MILRYESNAKIGYENIFRVMVSQFYSKHVDFLNIISQAENR